MAQSYSNREETGLPGGPSYYPNNKRQIVIGAWDGFTGDAVTDLTQ